MELLKVTALTSMASLALSFVIELYFGLTAKPYLFGFPHKQWPLFVVAAVIWAASFGLAYYVVFQRATFYGS
jgi:hypothetical protein